MLCRFDLICLLSLSLSWSLTHLKPDASVPNGIRYAQAERKEKRFTSKSPHFPDECRNLNNHPPVWTHSPMSPRCSDSRGSYSTGQIQGPSLWEWHFRGTEGPDAGGLEVLMGLLHRASSQWNTLLLPKEGECDHVFISLTPGREPNP